MVCAQCCVVQYGVCTVLGLYRGAEPILSTKADNFLLPVIHISSLGILFIFPFTYLHFNQFMRVLNIQCFVLRHKLLA